MTITKGIISAFQKSGSPGPSPKSRSRKSRHKRNNSRGSAVQFQNPNSVMSPTKDALHHELEAKTAVLQEMGEMHITPSQLKYFGPGTAIRELSTSQDEDQDTFFHKHVPIDSKNLNDVCFGCDGGCSDATCSSKRSSRISADIESNACDTSGCTSPTQGLDLRDLETKAQGHTQGTRKGQVLSQEDPNQNVKSTHYDKLEYINENQDNENGNSSSQMESSMELELNHLNEIHKNIQAKFKRSIGDLPEDHARKVSSKRTVRDSIEVGFKQNENKV